MSHEERSATGDKGEERATRYLISEGCAIVERNWHAHPGEIDIVALCPSEEGGETLAFVEVRTRHGREGLAEESISIRKAASMAATAYAYLEETGIDPESASWRIDLITVAIDGARTIINWIKGAV